MISILLATALTFLAPIAPDREGDSPAVGHWLGVLKLGPTELPLVLHVEEGEDGLLSGVLDSPDQGAFGMRVDRVSLDGQTLTFEAEAIAARFEGTLDEEGETIAGTFTQAGRATPLSLSKTAEDDLPQPVTPPEVLLGNWLGPIELPTGGTLRVALRVEEAEGRRRAFFDSIDQDARGIPVTAVSVEGEAVRFEVKSIGGTFEGTFEADRTRIKGTWTQSILSLPLTLEKVEELAALNRPQHPEPPFPYRVEEVTFANEAAGISLAGTLTIPEGEGPFPVSVLVSGSGPQDRDETIFGHKPFLVIADHLTRNGVAVLRFDDRGVGQSEGEFSSATTEDFASDARAAVRFLKGRAEIDPGKVGIIGHSEGGVVGPMVAAEEPGEVAFLVLLAGTGVNGREIILHQAGLIARASGVPNEEVDRQVKELDELTSRMISGDARNDDAEELAQAVLAASGDEDPDDSRSRAISEMDGPWFRFFLTHDPSPVLRRVDCPVLALFGEKDLQVDPSQNAPEVDAALKEAGHERSEVEILPGLNHLFQTASSGSPTEYGAIEETIAPELLDRVAEWVQSVTGRE